MGRTFSVAAWGPDSVQLARAVAQAFDSVHLVDSLLTLENDSSELSRLNRSAGSGALCVSSTLAALMRKALAVARLSGGAFDPTGKSYRGVNFDSAERTVTLRRGLTLDFTALARGYALDRALLPLTGVADSAVLDFGGQYLVRSLAPVEGQRSGRRVGVVDPDNSLASVATIELGPGTWSVSTMSAVEQAGEIVDPRSGQPATRVRAVTTVAHDGLTAGVWSAAFYVLGCDSALALAPSIGGMGVVCADRRVRWTPNLDGRVLVTTDSGGPAATGPAPAPGRALPAAGAPSGSTKPEGSPDSSR